MTHAVASRHREKAYQRLALGHLAVGQSEHLATLTQRQGQTHTRCAYHRAFPLRRVHGTVEAEPPAEADALEGGVPGRLCDGGVGEGGAYPGGHFLAAGEVHLHRPVVDAVGEQQHGKVRRLDVLVDAALAQVPGAIRLYVYA